MTKPTILLRCARRTIALGTVLAAALVLQGCIFTIDIQQGNVLDEDAIGQVEVGMTRSAVQFLLGTPTVRDSFHPERWDYPYYLRKGHSKDIEQHWLVVYFESDRVVRLERDLELDPTI
jgi:outer membrane protein assembly factor BamE